MVGTKTSVNMVEGCADSLSEDLILQAIRTGQRALGPIIDLQNELREKVSPEPREFDLQLPSEELIHRVDDLAASELSRALSIEGKKDRNQAVSAIKENIREELLNEDAELEGWAFSAAF